MHNYSIYSVPYIVIFVGVNFRPKFKVAFRSNMCVRSHHIALTHAHMTDALA